MTDTVLDHPGHLGDLAQIFLRRRIAIGIDGRGHVVLVRPDSIQVDFGGDDSRRKQIVDIAAGMAPDNADGLLVEQSVRTGILPVKVPASSRGINEQERWSVEDLRPYLERFTEAGVRPEYRHVFLGSQGIVPRLVGASAHWAGEMAFTGTTTSATTGGQMALLTTAEPATEPAFLREPLSIRGRPRPKMLVLDTGLMTQASRRRNVALEPAHPDLRTSRGGKALSVQIHPDWRSDTDFLAFDDEDEPDDDGSGTLDFEAGHGTFITGIIRQLCPDADIYPAGVLSSFGDGDTAHVLGKIAWMQERWGTAFDIVVMSFGAFFADDDPGTFGDRLRELLPDAVLVAAAGNQQTCRPYFPAALPEVIGVGGLEAGGRAWFTNFGPWVDASAPAIDVISTFFDDFTEIVDERPRRHFQRWARWSGTSFSAPKVAALIAQEMYLYGGSAGDAWKRLTSHNHHRVADLGIVFNA